RRALRAHGWRALAIAYHLQEVGPAIAYPAPLIESIVVIGQQVISGHAQEAIQKTINRAPGFIPHPTG
ncbi:MAG: hypothetical protein L3K17_10560, partial [Thermoplasmata archaeon]|nr:hypothetical protein [Thermoplasmata archaeon]